MDFRDALTRRIGPLPAWAWGLALGGGITAVRVWRDRNAVEPEPVDVNDGTTTGDGSTAPDDPTGGIPTVSVPPSWGSIPTIPPASFIPTLPSSPSEPSPDPIDTPAPVRTNLTWQQEAYDRLAALGLAPVAVSDALSKYLAGEPVTAQEEAIISQALRLVGRPPDGAPPITRAAPTPSVAPPPQAPAPSTTPAPLPAPPAAPASKPGRPVLRQGSSGERVSALQAWLNSNTGARLTVDGTYGPATAAAVQNFQRFMEGGTVKTGTPGVVDAHWWGVIDYVSALNGVPSIP